MYRNVSELDFTAFFPTPTHFYKDHESNRLPKDELMTYYTPLYVRWLCKHGKGHQCVFIHSKKSHTCLKFFCQLLLQGSIEKSGAREEGCLLERQSGNKNEHNISATLWYS